MGSQAEMNVGERRLLSGNEAIALAALDAGVHLGTGYPGTPSTEILENFDALGGRAQWAPNEKVALEVGIGAAFGQARVLVTMKHVGVNVAADPLFTLAYTGLPGAGALVLVSADDPGMASSQNEQDNRRFAVAAGVPMFEPSDSQEAYDYTLAAFALSRRWAVPVMLRTTTRVNHSKSIVVRRGPAADAVDAAPAHFERNVQQLVMIPAFARKAHRKLRQKLDEIALWSETCPQTQLHQPQRPAPQETLGIITSGISFMHVREAAPSAKVLKLGLTYPLPLQTIQRFVQSVDRCVVVEEGDPYLVEQLRYAGIEVEDKPAMYRFGEFSVDRVRRILARDTSPEPQPVPGKPPQLCKGCPHATVFTILRDMGCIVAGDIGCYTLGVLPPYQALDTCVCMGASIGVGLGLRHVLPENEARKVVSVIGDSTFMHSGVTGLVEMVYNPPATGHVVLILDNGTTAMTGQQEHPGTGRTLAHDPTGKISYEDLARSLGIKNVHVMDAVMQSEQFKATLAAALAGNELTLIVTRKPCILAAGKIRQYEKAAVEGKACSAVN